MKRITVTAGLSFLVAHCCSAGGAEELVQAVAANNGAAVAEALKAGADPNQRYAGAAALHLAAEYGVAAVTDLLLKSGAKPHGLDSYGRTPLIWAAMNGHSEVAQLLLSARCDPNWRDEEGNSALSAATERNDTNVVKLLVGAGAKVSPDDGKPLRVAVKTGNTELVRSLLGAGAQPCAHPENDIDAFTAASGSGPLELVKLLVENLGTCATPKVFREGVYSAAREGNVALLEYFLQLAAHAPPETASSAAGKHDPDKKSSGAALAAAIAADRFETARVLIEQATDLTAQNLGAVLPDALKKNQSAMFDLLIEQGAALDVQNAYGQTALLVACSRSDLEKAKFLLSHGASVKKQDNSELTPLLAACGGGSAPIVELLLKNGSTIRETDRDKRGPLLTAVANRRLEVCTVLVRHGCDVNAADPLTGFTPLHYAASEGDLELARLLISLKARPDITDKRHQTPGDVAEERGATEIVELLSNADRRRKSKASTN